MKFKPISIEEFVILYSQKNPSVNKLKLTHHLFDALMAYQMGLPCSCGKDLWVVGSAFGGKTCFRCFTGKADSSDAYEILDALPKSDLDLDFSLVDDPMFGYFDANGNQFDPEEVPKPTLCKKCKNCSVMRMEIFCNLMRGGQQGKSEFDCPSFVSLE